MSDATDIDRAALARLIAADGAARGETVSKLGYFCAPFRPAEGPFADQVVKVYQAIPDRAAAERMAKAHDDYVRFLRQGAVVLPDTRFVLLEEGRALRPVILQRALDPETMLRPMIAENPLPEALDLMEDACLSIARFWSEVPKMGTRIGFHPSIRNFAWEDGRIVFLDTFPPLVHYTREEMGQLLLTFSASPWMRRFGPLLRRTVTGIQDEWYSETENYLGLIGSACRLRPPDAPAILDWGRAFAAQALPEPVGTELAVGLDRPPRLPGYWTTVRRALGLQGAPNV